MRNLLILLSFVTIILSSCVKKPDESNFQETEKNSETHVSMSVIETLPETNNPVQEDCFIWDGNIIVGLSEKGKQRSELVIPERCTEIASYVFYNAATESILFQSDRDLLLNAAFYGAANLQSIILPENLTVIPDDCFRECRSLVDIVIPDSVVSIGDNAFRKCTSLKLVTLPKTSLTHLGSNCFAACESLLRLDFPDSLLHIPDYVCHMCLSLSTITLGCDTNAIGSNAFAGTNISEIYFPENSCFETETPGVLNLHPSAFGSRCNKITCYVIKHSWCDVHSPEWCQGFHGIYFYDND